MLERFAHRQVLEALDDARIGASIEELEQEALADLVNERGANLEGAAVRRRIVRLRLKGQETALEVEPVSATEAGSTGVITALFADRYRAVYGYPPPEHPIEVESIRVLAATAPAAAKMDRRSAAAPRARKLKRRTWFGGWRSGELLNRESLAPGFELAGPCLVQERHSITVVEPGWKLRVDDAKALILSRVS